MRRRGLKRREDFIRVRELSSLVRSKVRGTLSLTDAQSMVRWIPSDV